jgi:hypothetical protein
MLGRAELLLLASWCRARGMRWMPGRAAPGGESLRLETASGPGAGRERLAIALTGTEFRLLGPFGDVLAVASELPALLDAVDGGVAEPAMAIAA